MADPSRILTIGWKLTPDGHPSYWLKHGATVGGQSDSDIIKIPTASMANHSVIIAQSGSGKSFFLGRLIEELVTESKARCIILDTDGDFRNINDLDGKVWDNVSYDRVEGRGKLTTESKGEFELKWGNIKKRFRSVFNDASDEREKLQIWWPSISSDFIAEDADSVVRNELDICHAVVKAISELVGFRNLSNRSDDDIIEEAQKLYDKGKQLGSAKFEELLREIFLDVDLGSASAGHNTPQTKK